MRIFQSHDFSVEGDFMRRGFFPAALAVLCAAGLVSTPGASQTIATLATGLDRPVALAVDGNGHAIVATAGNDLIEISTEGDRSAVTTLGTPLGTPQAVAVDDDGDLFVLDGKRHALLEYPAVDRSGTPITLSAISLSQPTALALDRSGNLFVSDMRGNGQSIVAELLAPDYSTVRQIGGKFVAPVGLAVDGSGNVFVGDGITLAVYVIPPADAYGAVRTLAGGFKSIAGLAVDRQDNLFVADRLAKSVVELPASADYATLMTLGGGFIAPGTIAVDADGNVFVSDVGGVLKELAAANHYSTVASLPASFGEIGGFAIDGTGDIVLPDTGACEIGRLSAASGYAASESLVKCFAVFNPAALAFDRAGNLFVADNGDSSIKRLSAASGFSQVERLPPVIDDLVGIAVDPGGSVYYADLFGNVGEIAAAGGYTNVRPLASGLNELRHIAVDAAGNVFATDVETSTIKEILADDGTVRTIGVPLEAPQGIAIDGDGNLYVAEFESNTVVKIISAGDYRTVEPVGAGFLLSDVAVDGAGDVFVVNGGGLNSLEEILASPAPALFASLLPTARSVAAGAPATIFATLVNAGVLPLDSCRISLPAAPARDAFSANLTLTYQTTDTATNAPTGTPDTPAAVPAGDGVQSFVITLKSPTPFVETGQQLIFACQGAGMRYVAPIRPGVDTIDLSFQDDAADIIALSATPSDDGIVGIPEFGTAAFAVASVNVGSAEQIAVSIDTNRADLPLTAAICQTDPVTARCLAPPAPSLSIAYTPGAAPTFSIFLQSTGPIAFDPAGSRVFVRFSDALLRSRGSTSVAVATH
jgi:streptogramin lyase